MTQDSGRTGPKGAPQTRDERLKQALKRNLQRRKAQARARKTGTAGTAGNDKG